MTWKALQADLLSPATHPTSAAPQDPPEGLFMPSLEPMYTIDISTVMSTNCAHNTVSAHNCVMSTNLFIRHTVFFRNLMYGTLIYPR